MNARSLGALRRERRMPAVEPTPGLDRAIRCATAAEEAWWNAARHLAYAGRVTNGTTGAAWARDRLRAWADGVALVDVDQLADELVDETAEHAGNAS